MNPYRATVNMIGTTTTNATKRIMSRNRTADCRLQLLDSDIAELDAGAVAEEADMPFRVGDAA
jgi:hypothetical protein